MKESQVHQAYEIARERYAELGILHPDVTRKLNLTPDLIGCLIK